MGWEGGSDRVFLFDPEGYGWTEPEGVSLQTPRRLATGILVPEEVLGCGEGGGGGGGDDDDDDDDGGGAPGHSSNAVLSLACVATVVKSLT